jgi:hypothetical protein
LTSPTAQDESADACAICLQPMVHAEDIALVKGCLHAYCAVCIVGWASARAARAPAGADAGNTPCPQCKCDFSKLYVHRQLDGSVTEHLAEEPVALLRRARWAAPSAVLEPPEDEPPEEDDEYGTDEEERLTRQHRVRLIGNRRFGGGGFVASGRQLARPTAPPPPPKAPPSKAPLPKTADAGAANPKRAKREAKAMQAAEKEALRRARRRERLGGAGAAGPAGEAETACCESADVQE